KIERRVFRSRLFDSPTNRHQLAVVHLAEKEERDVQILRFHPLDIGPGAPQALLEGNHPFADCGPRIKTDKGSHAWHNCIPGRYFFAPFSILAQVSASVTARLKTSLCGVESLLSTQK